MRFAQVFLLCTALWTGTSAAALPAEHPAVGLVLSGGGARGFAHIGALKALEELHVKVDLIAATSMGAMVGGGYATGYSADEIRSLALGVDWAKMFAPRADRAALTWRRKNDDNLGLADTEIGISSKGFRFPSSVVPTQELEIFLASATRPVSRVNNLRELAIPFSSIATNLVSGERVVLSKGTTLSTAMRASMSVPAAFAPVPYGEALLIDGGLSGNLPVDVARSMGAKRIIAVNVGTPLLTRDKLDNVLGVMGQAINLLTEQNVRKSLAELTENDVLITPELTGFSTSDFNKAEKIIEAGYRAVMAQKDALAAFRTDDEEYAAWRTKVSAALQNGGPHRLSRVLVADLKNVNPQAVLNEADIDTDKPVTDEAIADSARRIWATGDFRSVPFRFEPGPHGTEVLVFEPEEKSWGYSSLRFGGNVQFDSEDTQNYNAILAHTWGWLNRWGAEWRNEIQVGEEQRFKSEWYQPLGAASDWYLMPRFEITRTPIDVYLNYIDDDKPYGRYITQNTTASLSLGYALGRTGYAEVTGGWAQTKNLNAIGMDGVEGAVSMPYAGASLHLDTLDNVNFPRKGMSFTVEYERYMMGDKGLYYTGHPTDNSWNVEGVLPFEINKDWSAVLSGRWAKSTMNSAYSLGGVFNLSGTPAKRFTGDRLTLGRLMVMRRVFPSLAESGIHTYAGLTYEIGKIYDGTYNFYNGKDRVWRQANAVFLGADTLIGPVYVVLGRTRGVSSSVMFYWGRMRY